MLSCSRHLCPITLRTFRYALSWFFTESWVYGLHWKYIIRYWAPSEHLFSAFDQLWICSSLHLLLRPRRFYEEWDLLLPLVYRRVSGFYKLNSVDSGWAQLCLNRKWWSKWKSSQIKFVYYVSAWVSLRNATVLSSAYLINQNSIISTTVISATHPGRYSLWLSQNQILNRNQILILGNDERNLVTLISTLKLRVLLFSKS